jgi:hypothetical protein
MIDVEEIMRLHADTVVAWHSTPIANSYEDSFLRLVCQQHVFNFELWHQEDIARSSDVGSDQIAQVKRKIDRFNQQRNDAIEKIDDAITEMLRNAHITARPGAKQNTETSGSVIDRLSIMALRLYHYEEQIERSDVDVTHLDKVGQRIQMCREQQRDLAQGLRELLADIFAGDKRHKTYRQMKMYNDSSLNPYLYSANTKKATAAAE